MLNLQRVTALALTLLAGSIVCKTGNAQEVKSAPGTYDYYLLNMSWSPAFCDTLKTLTPAEQAARQGSTECSSPHSFVLHGLWPQNFDGTYPGNCSDRPGPQRPERYLDMTPDLSLIKHEWAKHGTCTTLSPDAFFSTARQAYTAVTIPETLKHVDQQVMLAPEAILAMFYKANPSFPQGSFALSCGRNTLTAIEACFSRDAQPIACQNIRTCKANVVKVEPEASSGIVQ
ncbi:MAG: ribonuclease T2 family protein [Janthinobacterium lividum]